MRIESNIEYWDERVLTFDPEKVLQRLAKIFSQTEIDPLDYSFDELERSMQRANESIAEPNRTRMIESMKQKNWTNGPVFKFKIKIDDLEITGYAKRYTTAFLTKTRIDDATETKIVEFLKSLEYGLIRSDTQTRYFSKPDEDFKGRWLLEESVKNISNDNRH